MIGNSRYFLKRRPYSAEYWNELLSQLARSTPLKGENCFVKNSHAGAGVHLEGVQKWQHPWTMKTYWDPEIRRPTDRFGNEPAKGAWCVKIVPGLVNGRAPAVQMRNDLIPPEARVWGNEYGKDRSDAGNQIEVLLTDEVEPFFVINSFMDATLLQEDGGAGGFPVFFRYLGSQGLDRADFASALFADIGAQEAASPGTFTTPGAGTQTLLNILAGIFTPEFSLKDDSLPSGPRFLFSVDIVLQVDRVGVETNFETGILGLPHLAGYNFISPSSAHYHARLYETPLYQPPPTPTLFDRLAGTYTEPTFDELLISRIYFLSPENPTIVLPVAQEGEISVSGDYPEIDGSWLPFAANRVFWNLQYASKQLIDRSPTGGILPEQEALLSLLAVLGGGAGFFPALVNVEFNELFFAQLEQSLNRSSFAGGFWTM